jgi:hypothetical protein
MRQILFPKSVRRKEKLRAKNYGSAGVSPAGSGQFGPAGRRRSQVVGIVDSDFFIAEKILARLLLNQGQRL